MFQPDLDFRRLRTIKTVGDPVSAKLLDHETETARLELRQSDRRRQPSDRESRRRHRIQFARLDPKDLSVPLPRIHWAETLTAHRSTRNQLSPPPHGTHPRACSRLKIFCCEGHKLRSERMAF